MIEGLALLGLNHKTAPVEVRERLAFEGEEDVLEALREGRDRFGLRELALLSTCNRVEVYGVVENPGEARDRLLEFLASSRQVPSEVFSPMSYFLEGEGAVGHLFAVASSLDSMVLGEPQILGQLKDAYQMAVRAGTVGFLLHRLFQRAFFVAKRVRRETGIGDGAISVSYVAVELAKKIFGDLREKVVLLVGAGEMGELAARHLKAAGVGKIIVINRTPLKAQQLAEKIGAEAVPFEALKEMLAFSDIVVSCTGASAPIIHKEDVSWALRKRRGMPLFIIDMAVPRDVDPEVNALSDAYLYDIDDLQAVALENAKGREKEAEKAKGIVEEEVRKFSWWYRSLEAAPTISRLKAWAEELRRREVEEVLRGVALDEEGRQKVEFLTRRIVNKILHPAVTLLKETAADGRGREWVDMIRCLFGLEGH